MLEIQALIALDHLQTSWLQVDAVCCGTALQACSKRGWQQGVSLFWQTRLNSIQPSLISTNVVVRASNHEPWESLLQFLSWMASVDFGADAHTFGAVLASFPWLLSIQLLRRIEMTPILLNTAISAPSMQNRKSWPCSLELLSEFLVKRLTADTVLLNTLLTTFERSCHWKSAVHLLALCTQRCGIATPNTVSCNACLSACDAGEEVEQALTLLQSMETEHHIQPDVVSFSAILSACAKTAQWEKALEQVANMRSRELSLDIIAYNAVTTACAEAMQWERCVEMLKFAGRSDQVTYNAILKGVEKSMLWQGALALLSAMNAKRLRGNLITYNTLMSTCQKCSEWERSVHLLAELEQWAEDVGDGDLTPDLVSYNSCLAACRKASAWQEALLLWRRSQDHRTRTWFYKSDIILPKEWAKHFCLGNVDMKLLQECRQDQYGRGRAP